MIKIRPFRPADESQLADLYEATVRRWAPDLYTPEQVEAWAMVARDTDRFHSMLTTGRTFVAVDASNQPVGFSGVKDSGRIASLYVAADATRNGIGTALLSHVVDYASKMRFTPLWSEASFLSRPLFERNGFTVTQAEHIMIDGIEFKRWIVCKHLDVTN